MKKPVVIITGAAGGIGSTTALNFAARGYALSLVDIDLQRLKELEEQLEKLPCEYLLIDGDLQFMPFVRSVIDKTVDQWGRIDVLINNAVWRTIETMKTMSLANWEKTMKISLTAPAFLAKYAAAIMEEREISGVILNISSVMSQRPGGTSPAYIACKGGIESLTYELAVLYGPKGIRVIAVNPGSVDTSLSKGYKDKDGKSIDEEILKEMNDNIPLQRIGKPEEIANVLYWLSSEEASFITGTSILVDGGFFHNFSSYKMKKL